MKNIRIGLIGISSALAGFVLQGCFAQQPLPECQVFTGDSVAGVTNYMALLKETGHTGTCDDLTHMEIGLTRINPAGTTDFSVLMRAQRPVDFVIGNQFTASTDTENDCTDYVNTEDCSECVDPIDAMDGDNVCQEEPDPVTRTDPADATNKGLTLKGKLSQFPTDGICSVDPMTSTFNFQAEDVTLVDGGTESFPSVAQKLEWTNFKIIMNAKVPGSYFTANLKLTEGTCSANYDVTAFWPIVTCTTDDECDPNSNLDAGRVTGSGISAEFKPVCNVDIGVCVPSVDVAKLK